MAPKKQPETKQEEKKTSESTKTEKKSTSTKVEDKKVAAAKTEEKKTSTSTKTEEKKSSTSTKTEKKSTKASVPVKTETVESLTEDDHTTSRKPTKDTVDSEFNSIFNRIEEEITRLEEKKKTEKNSKVTGIQFLKQLRKMHKVLHRNASRVLKIKKSNRVTNENSGFKKPVRVSVEICKFFGWDQSKLYSRTEVTREVCKYVRENNLQDTDNKRIIRPDAKLTTLLNYDPEKMPIEKKTGQKSPLYYCMLQKLLTRHFPDSGTNKK